MNADAIIGANQDIFGYNLYAYCSNNPIILSDSTGQGFFKGVCKFAVKTKQKISSTKNKIKNTVTNFFGKLVSINYNISKSNSIKQGNELIGTLEVGDSTSITVKTIGNSDSLIKVNINRDVTDPFNGSIGLEVDTTCGNVQVEIGSTSINVSGGLSLDTDNTYSGNFGLDGYNFYIGSKDNSILGDATESVYGRANINIITPILIYYGYYGMQYLPTNATTPLFQY